MSSRITLKSFAFSVFFISMMGSMLDSLVYYVVTQKNFLNGVVAVNINMFSMSLVIIYLLWVASARRSVSTTKTMSVSFSILLVWNEVSMALLLRVLGYHTGNLGTLAGYLNLFGLAVTNYLFLIPMIVEMAFFIISSMKPGILKRTAFALLLMQVADPAVVGDSSLVFPLLVAYSVIMILAVYYVFSYVYRNIGDIRSPERNAVTWYILVIGISTVGLFQPAIISSTFGIAWSTFGISMIAAMTLYFEVILGRFTPLASLP
ncbi:MAG: hypothetical protein QW597_05735 [Thermoplasmataceae archaeon]